MKRVMTFILRYKIRSRSIEQYGGFETRLVPQAAEVLRFRMYVAETILTETYHGDERVTFFFFSAPASPVTFFPSQSPLKVCLTKVTKYDFHT